MDHVRQDQCSCQDRNNHLRPRCDQEQRALGWRQDQDCTKGKSYETEQRTDSQPSLWIKNSQSAQSEAIKKLSRDLD